MEQCKNRQYDKRRHVPGCIFQVVLIHEVVSQQHGAIQNPEQERVAQNPRHRIQGYEPRPSLALVPSPQNLEESENIRLRINITSPEQRE